MSENVKQILYRIAQLTTIAIWLFVLTGMLILIARGQ
jgi:hypothetical protein